MTDGELLTDGEKPITALPAGEYRLQTPGVSLGAVDVAALVAKVEQMRERVASQKASIEALRVEKQSMRDNRDFLGSLAIALLVRIGGDAVLTDLEITGEPKTERNLRVTAETEGRFCAHVETRPVAPEPLDETGPEFD
jgi:hypothetical protein